MPQIDEFGEVAAIGTSTKERVFNAALYLFSQKGYSATSVRQIAAEAKVNQASVYWAFKDKKAILNEILSRYLRNLDNRILSDEKLDELLKTDSPRQILERCLPSFRPDEARLMFRAYRIVCMEQFTSEKARDIITSQLHEKFIENLTYVLGQMVEKGSIPKINTVFYAQIWVKALFSDSIMWVHSVDDAIRDIESECIFRNHMIEMALSGSFPT